MSNISTRTMFILAASFGLSFALLDTIPQVIMPLSVLMLLAATFGALSQFKRDSTIAGLRLGALLNLVMGATLLPAVLWGSPTSSQMNLMNPLTYLSLIMLASTLISAGAVAGSLTALVRKLNNRLHEK